MSWLMVLCSMLLTVQAATKQDNRFKLSLFIASQPDKMVSRGSIYYDPFTAKSTRMIEFIPEKDAEQHLVSDQVLLVVKAGDQVVSNTTFHRCALFHADEMIHVYLDEVYKVFKVSHYLTATEYKECPVSTTLFTKKPTLTLSKTQYPNRPVLSKLPEVDARTGQQVQPDKRSFIQKYWMYIVPVLLMVLLGGGNEEPQQGKAESKQ